MKGDFFRYCPSCSSNRITFSHCFNCPDCGFTYFHNIAAATGALIVCEDKVLFTVRAKDPGKGKLGLPGGFVDANETAEEALTREVREEIGLDIIKWTYFCSEPNDYHYKDIPYKTTDIFFIARLDIQPAIKCDKEEIVTTRWINPAAIDLDSIAFPSLRKAVEKYCLSLGTG